MPRPFGDMPDHVLIAARLHMPRTGLSVFHALRPMWLMPALRWRLLAGMRLLRLLAFVAFVSVAPVIITIWALAKCRHSDCKS